MSDEVPELKPCPFCGGPARADTGPVRELWGVICDSCDTWQDSRSPSREEAVGIWNLRADLHSLPGEVVGEMRAWAKVADAIAADGDAVPEELDLLCRILAAIGEKP